MENQEPPRATITLTVYDWHKLLKELEYLQQICNRDRSKCIDVWEKISTQLSGYNQIINGSEKHRKLFPEEFKKQEVKEETKVPIKKGFWSRMFGE